MIEDGKKVEKGSREYTCCRFINNFLDFLKLKKTFFCQKSNRSDIEHVVNIEVDVVYIVLGIVNIV